VEITDDVDPKLVIKRISRGDQDIVTDNQVTDSLTMRLNSSIVDIPQVVFPVDVEIAPECVTLQANEFSSLLSGDFTVPIAEPWKNFENWYFDEDTQDGDDLTDETIFGLDEFSSYQWRVRYRDKEMNWSNWSDPATFTTGASIAQPNLLLNPGAEDSLSNWTIIEGVVESLKSNVCEGVPSYLGDRYFAVGGLCEHSEVGRAIQNIDVSAYADSIDTGIFRVNFGGYFSNYAGSDQPEMRIIFLDENNNDIGQSNTLTTLNSSWTMLGLEELIPVETKSIQVELKGTRNAGTDNDSYFDELFLRVGSIAGCDAIVSIINQPIAINHELKIYPNPTSGEAKIIIPKAIKEVVHLNITDIIGNKILPIYTKNENIISIETSNLTQGTYFIWLRSKKGILGVGKLTLIKE